MFTPPLTIAILLICIVAAWAGARLMRRGRGPKDAPCPGCGRPNRPEAEFCHHCGDRLK